MTKETLKYILITRNIYCISKEIRKAREEKNLPWLSAIDMVMDELHDHNFWLTRDEEWELGDYFPEL